MDRFRRFLVALDRSDMDSHLIKAALVFAKDNPGASFYFFHASPSLEIPEKVREQYPDLIAPIDETIEANIQMDVDEIFNGADVEIHIDVREGNPSDQILKYASEKEINLIILGKKPHSEGSGHHKDKIVNNASASVMIIPKGHDLDIPKHILVSVDFSEASKYAFERAFKFAKHHECRITCFHSYEVPTGYHTTGKSFEEFADIMEENSKDHFEEFIEPYDLEGVEVDNVNFLDKDGHSHEKILEAAKKTGADLIVVGSKGRTSLSKVLLGSVANKLLHSTFDLPVLVVKRSGKNLGFLEALLEI